MARRERTHGRHDRRWSSGNHESGIGKDPAKLVRCPYRIAEVGARLRVKIDTELVHALRIEALDWPRVVAQRAQIGHPRDNRQFGWTDFVGSSTRGESDCHGLYPVRHSLAWGALLVEGLTMRVSTRAQLNVRPISTRPALHGDWPIPERGEDPVTH